MRKKISIFGSTGSIGLSTLKIIDKKNKDFKINILSADKNYKLICNQIRKYNPIYYVISNYQIYKKVKKKFKNKKTIILNNFKNIILRTKDDVAVSSIPGIAGLEPTILMIKFSKKVLIANKESIICGWNLIKLNAKKYKTKIIPVDSEHFSIFTLLKNQSLQEIKKIYITASGGPFLNYKKSQMKNISPNDALRHPKWKMGKKISVDSSTLMNKILELIEAQKLFNIPLHKIDILIHPNSLVHAIIEFKNGISKFIYHETSMIIPLANAIYENQIDISELIKSKINKNQRYENLIFKNVNEINFPVIKIKKRINEYPSTSIIINATNEILVDLFLRKKLSFLSINKHILNILRNRNYKKYAIRKPKNLDQIIEIDRWARESTLNLVKLKI